MTGVVTFSVMLYLEVITYLSNTNIVIIQHMILVLNYATAYN